MFETATFDFDSQDVKDLKPITAVDLEEVRSNCTKPVSVEELVVKDLNTAAPSIHSQGNSPGNVKPFRKNLSRRSTSVIAAGILPIVIGGSDLVPHNKRLTEVGDERDDDEDSDFLSRPNFDITVKGVQGAGGAPGTGLSPRRSQAPTLERAEQTSSAGARSKVEERRRKACGDEEGANGTGSAEGNRIDNGQNGGSAAKRPRRTIVSMF